MRSPLVSPSILRRLASLLAVLGLVGCGHERERAHPAAEGTPVRHVITSEVQRVVADDADGWHPGTVRARNRAALAARLGASVVALPYRAGETVGAGAVVARLDDTLPRAALAAAQSAQETAQADLARLESLVARQAATPRERDEARARAAVTRSALAAASESLSFAVVRAPFAGTLARRQVDVGDVVSPGQPLVEIEAAGGLELVATLPAAVAARLRPGALIEASVDGQAQPLPVTVRAVSQAGDPTTHRFEVRADLPLADGLRSGLFARLRVPGAASRAALGEGSDVSRSASVSVPARATFARGGLMGVFVVLDGRARLRFVALGEAHGEQVEVRAGLEPGERVVLDPADLGDGARVEESR